MTYPDEAVAAKEVVAEHETALAEHY